MATTINTKGSAADLATSLAAGTAKHIALGTQVLVAGGSFTPDQVVAKLQAFAKLRADVEAAKAGTRAKLATERTDGPPLRTFLDAYVAFVKAAFGASPDVLADFGVRPKKVPAPKTAEAKAAASAKRASTRAARHVMGSQQRKSVVGNVVGIAITPITAPAPVGPAASSTAPSPAGTGTAAPPAGSTPHTP